MDYSIFPAINATLNGASACLLLIGRALIARKRIAAHRAVMISAFITSTLFLICYLTYHIGRQLSGLSASVHFQGTGWPRTVYFTILISHVVLAAVILPMALLTLARALVNEPEVIVADDGSRDRTSKSSHSALVTGGVEVA